MDVTRAIFCHGYHKLLVTNEKYSRLPANKPWTYTPIEDGWLCVDNVNRKFFPWGDTAWLCPTCKQIYHRQQDAETLLQDIRTVWEQLADHVILVDGDCQHLLSEISSLLDRDFTFADVMVLGSEDVQKDLEEPSCTFKL